MVKAPKVRALTVRFTEEEAAALTQLSESSDTPEAAIVRKAVRQYLEREGSLPTAPTKKPAKK